VTIKTLAILLALGSTPENAEAIRAGVRAAKPALAKCGDNRECWCEALKKVRFDVKLDGGTLVVTYPLVGHTGPSFTLDTSGRVIDCKPWNQK
jgi:hypothetical protein